MGIFHRDTRRHVRGLFDDGFVENKHSDATQEDNNLLLQKVRFNDAALRLSTFSVLIQTVNVSSGPLQNKLLPWQWQYCHHGNLDFV